MVIFSESRPNGTRRLIFRALIAIPRIVVRVSLSLSSSFSSFQVNGDDVIDFTFLQRNSSSLNIYATVGNRSSNRIAVKRDFALFPCFKIMA